MHSEKGLRGTGEANWKVRAQPQTALGPDLEGTAAEGEYQRRVHVAGPEGVDWGRELGTPAGAPGTGLEAQLGRHQLDCAGLGLNQWVPLLGEHLGSLPMEKRRDQKPDGALGVSNRKHPPGQLPLGEGQDEYNDGGAWSLRNRLRVLHQEKVFGAAAGQRRKRDLEPGQAQRINQIQSHQRSYRHRFRCAACQSQTRDLLRRRAWRRRLFRP